MDEIDSFGTRGRPVMFRCSIGGKKALPFETTSFVGRRTESTEVRNLLRNSRLVTITGTGGVGKTRLALRVATEYSEISPTGRAWSNSVNYATVSCCRC